MIQTLDLYAGDSKDMYVAVNNDTGELMDLNGVEDIILVISATRQEKGEPAVVKTLTGGGITIEGLGIFKASLTSSDTKGMLGAYYLEAKVIDGFGNVATVLEGEVEVKRSIIVSKNLM